jgi:hypothetical protein
MNGRCDINRRSTRFWMHLTHAKIRYLQWYSNRSSVGDFRGLREHISFVIKLLNKLLISLIAVFIFLPIFVHRRRWAYSQCRSRITKFCFFFIKSAQIFYFSKRKFTFQNVLFHFCTQNAHRHFTGFRENPVSHKPRTDINSLKTTALGHTKAA